MVRKLKSESKWLTFYFKAPWDSCEATVIRFCRASAISTLELIRRALIAFYLPFAKQWEGLPEAELKRLALSSIHELELQTLQLKRAFWPELLAVQPSSNQLSWDVPTLLNPLPASASATQLPGLSQTSGELTAMESNLSSTDLDSSEIESIKMTEALGGIKAVMLDSQVFPFSNHANS